ncbi:unnamed protein product [Hermetia illucens]|uniref:TIR domain-containing protein n=1 Tax=Hermetia illucens TaxID=343691 RepID=A0A7R8UHG0_HERIL|nr:toll-like receptor 6 isoform X2 [Hermetia illucens]CAD7080960.1 unnamed protein product [Hermetia illucens]
MSSDVLRIGFRGIVIFLLCLNVVGAYNPSENTVSQSGETTKKDNTKRSDRIKINLISSVTSAPSNTQDYQLQVYNGPNRNALKNDWPVSKLPPDFLPDSNSEEDAIDESLEPCLLDVTSMLMSWWIHPNGTLVDKLFRDVHFAALDLSHMSNSEEKIYEETTQRTKLFAPDKYLAFSAAGNSLHAVPFKALSVINRTLSYLSLRGNDFSSPDFGLERHFDMSKAWSWAQFPILPSLQELDLSNCSIQFMGAEIFENFPNLSGLYLSHNNLVHISSDLFKFSPLLTKLDLSYIESIDFPNSHLYDPGDDIYHTINEGLSISEFAFDNLKNLLLLDVSHTRISPYSVRAFSHLGPELVFLSLCYTFLPLLPSKIFSETSLRVLDLSGNPAATLSLHEETFAGLHDSLEVLSFENSRLHDLNWVKSLEKLEILQLSGNNINVLHRGNFLNLKSLKLFDLSSNHIGNWYHRIFEENTKLRLLNLRSNNINIITSEMYRDFANLSFLAIGHNDFICSCALRDLIDIAVDNLDLMNTTTLPLRGDNETGKDDRNKEDNRPRDSLPIWVWPTLDQECIKNKIVSQILAKFDPLFKQSHKNIIKTKKKFSLTRSSPPIHHYSNSSPHHHHHHHPHPFDIINDDNSIAGIFKDEETCQLVMPDGELLHFNFVLLDYEPENYWCYNASTNTVHELAELDPCDSRPILAPIENLNTTHIFIIGFAVLSLALILIIPLYLKWWHIKYFFIILKRSAILKLLNNKKEETSKPTSYMYDIFVSYCDRDRDWVLDELLPHIEGNQETSICLHERDFQVGLSILENIIQCMDKSRCFLLVISKCFLSSQWCQFEMYLAQHRLFEAKKEHLILILLEDIPRHKRPKSLQYLMQIKTYIKWPTEASGSTFVIKSVSDERKLFWVRLKRSLSSIERGSQDTGEESSV